MNKEGPLEIVSLDKDITFRTADKINKDRNDPTLSIRFMAWQRKYRRDSYDASIKRMCSGYTDLDHREVGVFKEWVIWSARLDVALMQENIKMK